ncbi:MAG TPA: M1 family aminopeptidase [Vicinamibacterales bacterium]
MLQPGVPLQLASDRASRVRDLRYQLALTIPAERSGRIAGRETIAFDLAGTAPLALDFEPNGAGAVHSVDVNGKSVSTALRNGHLVLSDALREGANRVSIDFDAGDAPLNRNDDYLYTIFVPARAHEAFPCFDQPDLKAGWSLTLDVPDGWETLANGAETSRAASTGRTRVTFAETAPISTYLFAFAAGKFSVERAERDGRAFRMLHRETDAAKVARNRDAIFDLHAAALKWLEDYTGIAYPFGKFDFVLVPAFQFGGMEHPGAIFYNASGLMLDPSATENQKLERASTISHETSHMWFGDLVTMRWFADVWMKEVFANFMAAKIVNPSFPHINHELRFLLSYYPAAYDVDRTAGSNPIRQPLENLKDAGTLYGAIIYQKAPIVMRQLEMLVGADRFRDGLREYLKRFQFGNASWPELIALLDARTPEDLAAWSRAWVEEAGRPVITTRLDVQQGRIAALSFRQRDGDQARGLTWTQNLQVALGHGGSIDLVPVHLAGSVAEATAAHGRPAPDFVLPNGAGLGYGEFHLDPASRQWLSQHVADVPDALTRGSAWVTLWDAVLDGELPAGRLIDLALAALPRETDELNVQAILSELQQAYWTFTPPAERTARAAALERLLRDRLDAAPTQSLKGAYFAALRNTALTAGTLEWLARVWRGDEQVTGLTLAETDYIVLAQELAVREVAGWQAILSRQVERTANPDRKARLQFVVPALSADPAERDRFFASLAAIDNRRHEAWVLDALRYLHHPLRAPRAERYIEPSLALLQEIQRTGDIFFPKRWTDMTLSGHRTPAAAATVRGFLDRAGAGYPDRLRRIILSSADDLFRASRM